MSLTTRLFKVSGSNIQSLYIADTGLQFSSKKLPASEDEFIQLWNKKMTLTTQTEVPFDKIKTITKENTGSDITLEYKATLGIGSEIVFSFNDAADEEALFNYLAKNQYFTRSEEQLSPINAALGYGVGLVITVGATIFCYYQALAIANGTASEPRGRRARGFMKLMGFLGDKGVLVIGIGIAGFIAYKLINRYKNPPQETKLLPPLN